MHLQDVNRKVEMQDEVIVHNHIYFYSDRKSEKISCLSLRLRSFHWVTEGSQTFTSTILVCCVLQTDLSSSQDVVPDGSASKVNVEICEAALHTHETVPERSRGRMENTTG